MTDQPPNPHQTLLGKAVDYPNKYDSNILQGIARSESRKVLGIDGASLPFTGADIWTCYELSWLDSWGKPHVGICEVTIPCDSQNIIESKSFKLYLNSLNEHKFDSVAELRTTLASDLAGVCHAKPGVDIFTIDEYTEQGLHTMPGFCLDDLEVENRRSLPDPNLLEVENDGDLVEEKLYSHLLKTNCPITGQPDWASVQFSYQGLAITHRSLLAYIVSFRDHQDFHEQCVEKMFTEILAQCKPVTLTVAARYSRRGGLDINPWRSTDFCTPSLFRTGRQ